MARPKLLTEPQKRFAYIMGADFKATQTSAAVKAGYSEKSARNIACDLMKNPDVLELIELHREQTFRRLEISPERIRNELAAIIFANPQDYYKRDDRGREVLKDIDELSPFDAAAIKEVKITQGRRGYTRSYIYHDKKGAIELAMKTEGMLKDRMEMTGADGGPILVDTIHNNTALEARINELVTKRTAGT